MNKSDKELMKMILADKDRYTIIVDNDAVWIQDNTKDYADDDYWIGFNEYGYNLIPIIFKSIGVKSEFV